jgi:hypothetical protein
MGHPKNMIIHRDDFKNILINGGMTFEKGC